MAEKEGLIMSVEITINLPDAIVDYIDSKIRLGEYLSRNDFIKHVLRCTMEKEEMWIDL